MIKREMKWLIMFTLIIITLTQISCSNSTSGQSKDVEGNNATTKDLEEDGKWQLLGPDSAKISQIQVSADGTVYLLSQGKLCLLQNDEFLDIGPQDEVAIFYVMENDQGKTLFAGGIGGAIFVKKADGPWEKAVSPVIKGQPVSTIAGDTSRGIVYVGQSSKNGGGLWSSQDEGKSWDKLTNISVRGLVVHPQDRDLLYIIDKAVYLSEDRGKHWEQIDTPANYGLLIHPLENQIIYIAYSKGVVLADKYGLVKNNDSFDLNGVMTCLEMNFIRYGEWAVAMWDYPSGSGGLYFSFDKGSSWTKTDETLDKVRIQDMRFDNKGDKLYIGTAGQGLWVLNLRKIR